MLLGPGQCYVDELTVSEAVRLIEVGVRLEAMARGLPSQPEPAPELATYTPNPIVRYVSDHPERLVEVVGLLEGVADRLGLEPGTA